ncbi:hypothetical protein GCM10022232_79890 [Streptomyces plumbiresistens]|uniref:Uncharacterized protein n=1 Tax=Streptomyces plumbiresistens TaxID=511811 RepID=A0ABP7TAU6_9ACTN
MAGAEAWSDAHHLPTGRINGGRFNRSWTVRVVRPAYRHAPNGLGRTGHPLSSLGGDTDRVRGPVPDRQVPSRPTILATAKDGGEALNHPLVEQGLRTLTPYRSRGSQQRR